MPNARTLKVSNYDDFREMIPTSGVFEMSDCEVEIWCPEMADTQEIEKMVKLIESMLHVTDVRIGSTIDNLTSEDYRVVITEVPFDIKKKFSRGK
jgi:hypothetical protein